MSTKTEKKEGVNRSFFQWLKNTFSFAPKSHSSDDAPLSLLLIQYDMIDEQVQEDLLTCIEGMLLLGWRVKVEPLPQYIQSESIGVHLHFDEGQLKFQERLLIKEECVVKKRLSSQRQDLSIELIHEG